MTSRLQRQPVITAATIAGLILAGWQVLVDQGILSALTEAAQTSLGVFVALAVPIISGVIAALFVTTTASPNLPVGTVVNADSDLPTASVTEVPQ